MSQDPYGQQDPFRSGNYEDYSQGYSSAPQPATSYGQPAPAQPQTPSYAEPPYTQPTYAPAPADPYGQPTYSDPTYGQAPYTQPGYAAGYQATPSYGLAPYSAAVDSNPRPSVSMPQAVKLWLKNWKNFSGRASRSEFWWVALAQFIVSMVLGIVIAVIAAILIAAAAASASASSSAPDGVIALIVFLFYGIFGLLGLAMFVPTLALSVRRLHDTNQSGWMYLLSFIPSVGGIILLVLLAQPSNPMGARFDDRAQPLYGPENI